MREPLPPRRFKEASGELQADALELLLTQRLDTVVKLVHQVLGASQVVALWQLAGQTVIGPVAGNGMKEVGGLTAWWHDLQQEMGTVVALKKKPTAKDEHAGTEGGIGIAFKATGFAGGLLAFGSSPQDFDSEQKQQLAAFSEVMQDHVKLLVAQYKAEVAGESRWRHLVEQHPEPILICHQGSIVYINQAGAHMLGAEGPQHLMGQPLSGFVAGDTPLLMQQHLEAIEQGKRLAAQDFDVCGLDGKKRRIRTHSAPITFQGKPATQSVWRDVTTQHAYERELIEAKERAEEMDRLKTTFLMNISHEIRTPLTSILGFSEIIADESEGELRMQAHLITDSGNRLMTTLNALLDLAEMEGKMMHLSPQRTDVVEQALRVLYLFKRKAQDRGLVLRLSVPRGHSVYAYLDQRALGRVLENLVSNAIKFTHQGTIELTIEVVSDDLFIHVDDTGIGITPTFVEQSFEAFQQESQGIQRMYEGSGLGLTLARRFVELMGGTIDVKSEKGKGSRFTVYLPGVVFNSSTAFF